MWRRRFRLWGLFGFLLEFGEWESKSGGELEYFLTSTCVAVSTRIDIYKRICGGTHIFLAILLDVCF